MKYYVTFQQVGSNARPIEHPSTADFETSNAAMLPNVGDYVQIDGLGAENAPSYSGRVKTRLFRYLGEENCGINIVVEANDTDDWGAVIKE